VKPIFNRDEIRTPERQKQWGFLVGEKIFLKMKVATAEEIRDIDRRAIQEYGIPGVVLMENAGAGTAHILLEKYGPLSGKRVGVVCGKGNNGGDGFVVARHLVNEGVTTEVALLTEKSKVQGDARINLDIADRMGIPILEAPDSESFSRVKEILLRSDLIVDAILGTGLTAGVTGFYKDVIELINSLQKPVVAVDIPSGLSSDTGEVPGSCIRANLTVTFGLPKRGLILYPAAEFVGELKVLPIGIPEKVIREAGIKVNLMEVQDIQASLAGSPLIHRAANSHKGTYGHVLVIAGSRGKTGAALMSSRSALRVGAGLVTLGLPESLNNFLEAASFEVMTVPLPETSEGTFSHRAATWILMGEDGRAPLLAGKNVVALGPGLSTHPETLELVYDLIRNSHQPLVIDADGINALARKPEILLQARAPVVITPHPGEMARFLGEKNVQSRRIEVAQETAKKYGIYVVLKGARTIISDPNGEVFINLTGNPGMATGGTGDVLTGILAGLIAQGLPILDALKIGVYLHGLAGDLAAQDKGEPGLIAGDVIEEIPYAIKKLSSVDYPLPVVKNSLGEVRAKN
jgi:NAD(P)H-hydrate epimerase